MPRRVSSREGPQPCSNHVKNQQDEAKHLVTSEPRWTPGGSYTIRLGTRNSDYNKQGHP